MDKESLDKEDPRNAAAVEGDLSKFPFTILGIAKISKE
jgi:hypothetical protein